MEKIDYTNAKRAPVLVCFVKSGDMYLLLKRSDKVLAYKNLWSSVAGFLDDAQSLEEKIAEELKEELGITQDQIVSIKKGPVYVFTDDTLGREWERHLVLATINTLNIKTDWEHTAHEWVMPEEIVTYRTTPGFLDDLKKIQNI